MNTYAGNQVFDIAKGLRSSQYELTEFTTKKTTTHVEAEYDGHGKMSFTLSRNLYPPFSRTIDMTGAFKADANVYFGFCGVLAASHRLQNVISNFTFHVYEPQTNRMGGAVSVVENGAATIAVATLAQVDAYATVFPEVTLEANSTLNVVNAENAEGDYRVAFETVRFPGDAAAGIASEKGTTELSNLVFAGAAPALNRLAGTFAADELELVVPSAWTRLSDVPLLDVRDVVWESGKLPAVHVVDADGNPIEMVVLSSGGIIRLGRRGLTIILR